MIGREDLYQHGHYMIDVNPLYVVLFGIVWLASECVIKWLWHTYKEHYHPMQEIKIDKGGDHGHS